MRYSSWSLGLTAKVCGRLLEGNIKGMLTTLPLVLDLHHPAMRERHWLQLMKVRMPLLPS